MPLRQPEDIPNGSYFNPGQNGPMNQPQTDGSVPPERMHPSPVRPDGEQRNMPGGGSNPPDSGGNPAMEGIAQPQQPMNSIERADPNGMEGNPMDAGLNHWNNRMKRDESFASVRHAWYPGKEDYADADRHYRRFKNVMMKDETPMDQKQHEMLDRRIEDSKRHIPDRQSLLWGWPYSGKGYTDRDDYYKMPPHDTSPEGWAYLDNLRKNRSKYVWQQAQSVGDTSQLGSRGWKLGETGRGLIFPGERPHTWPEEHGTHMDYAKKMGLPLEKGWPFGISPKGEINDLGQPITPEIEQVINNHPTLTYTPLQAEFPSMDWTSSKRSFDQSIILPWTHTAEDLGLAHDFEISQVAAPGPSTVEVDTGEGPIMMQHEDPAVLDHAKKRLESSMTKEAIPAAALALLPEGIAALVGGGAAAGAAEGAAAAGGTALAEGAGAAAAGGAAEGAGAAGAAGGGGGGGLMGGVGNFLKWQGVGSLMKGAMGGSQSPASGPGGGTQSPAGRVQMAHVVATDLDDDLAHPSSIPERNETDPDDIDPHEKHDGDNQNWQQDFDVNGDGGTDQPGEKSEDDGIPLDSDLGKRFQMALPLILHYFQSEDSGENDPIIQQIHQALESERPGYLDGAGDLAGANTMIAISPKEDSSKKKSSDSMPPNTNLAPAPTDRPERHPATMNLCQYCGATILPGQPCPQCGAISPTQVQQFTGGFESTDSFYIDDDFLQKLAGPPPMDPSGGGGMPMDPSQGMPMDPSQMMPPPEPQPPETQGPHSREQFKAVADLLSAQGREDEITTMLQQPWDYADELAEVQQQEDPPEPPEPPDVSDQPQPAQEEAPPENTMPVPGMSQVSRVSADNIARKCPKCHSHTTGLVDVEKGTSHCHTCGHDFDTSVTTDDLSSTDASHSAASNSVGIPSADQEGQYDVSKQRDSSHQWVDNNGNDLRVGQTYEMYSKSYEIPDIVRIESVKPDSISYTIVGVYNLEHRTEITRQEAMLDGLTFKAIPGSEEQPDETDETIGPDDNNSDNTAYEGSPEVMDMSHPHARYTVQLPSPPMLYEETSFPNPEDRQTLSEIGRQSVKTKCEQCNREIYRRPDERHLCGSCDEHPVTYYRQDPGVPRIAGQQYTQMEQRTLIDEPGIARNADKLNLVGTHYADEESDEQLFM